jgi:ribosomal protein S4
VFKRWYLPETLPDVRPRKRVIGNDATDLDAFALREKQKKREERRLHDENEKGLAPVGSLMLREVERRIDVFIFRCCFAHSVYEARRLVIHGNVLLNGKKVRLLKGMVCSIQFTPFHQHQNANTRLTPGDMVSVNPEAIRFLRGKPYAEVVEQLLSTKSNPADVKTASETVTKPTPEAKDSPPQPVISKDAPKRHSVSQLVVRNLTPFNPPPYASPHLFIPAYIEPSFATCSAIFVRHPTARPGYSEIPTPYDADGEVVRLAWEWYAKVRSRIRSRRQLARAPEDRDRVNVAKRFGLLR